jgi:hypothetical protein
MQKEIIALPVNNRKQVKEVLRQWVTSLNNVVTDLNKLWVWKTEIKKWISSVWWS